VAHAGCLGALAGKDECRDHEVSLPIASRGMGARYTSCAGRVKASRPWRRDAVLNGVEATARGHGEPGRPMRARLHQQTLQGRPVHPPCQGAARQSVRWPHPEGGDRGDRGADPPSSPSSAIARWTAISAATSSSAVAATRSTPSLTRRRCAPRPRSDVTPDGHTSRPARTACRACRSRPRGRRRERRSGRRC